MNSRDPSGKEINYLEVIRQGRPSGRSTSPQPSPSITQNHNLSQPPSNRETLQSNQPRYPQQLQNNSDMDRFRPQSIPYSGARSPPMQPRSPTHTTGRASPTRSISPTQQIQRDSGPARLQETPSFYAPPGSANQPTSSARSRPASPMRVAAPVVAQLQGGGFSFGKEQVPEYRPNVNRDSYNPQRDVGQPYQREFSQPYQRDDGHPYQRRNSQLNEGVGGVSPRGSSRSIQINNNRRTPPNERLPPLQVFDQFYQRQAAQRNSQTEAIKKQFRDKFHKEYEAETKYLLKEKSDLTKCLLVLFGCLIAMLLYFSYNLPIVKPYCNEPYSISEECVACPDKANCRNGRIESCHSEYKLVNGQCVDQEKDPRLMLSILNSALKMLTEARGRDLCDDPNSGVNWWGVWAINSHLEELYGDNQDFKVNHKEAMKLLKTHPEVQFTGTGDGIHFFSSTPSFTPYCFLKVFWRENWILVSLIFLLIILLVFLISSKRKQLLARARAAEMYSFLEAEVRGCPQKAISTPNLCRLLKNKYNLKDDDLDDIWLELERQAVGKKVLDIIRREDRGMKQSCWVFCE